MISTTYTAPAQTRAELALHDDTELPYDFDPRRWPIIAKHVFGITSINDNDVMRVQPVGPIAAEIVADIRFRHHVEYLHRLGPRAVGELLAEIGAERGIRTVIDDKIAQYAELDPATVTTTGADDFWPAPLTEVRS